MYLLAVFILQDTKVVDVFCLTTLYKSAPDASATVARCFRDTGRCVEFSRTQVACQTPNPPFISAAALSFSSYRACRHVLSPGPTIINQIIARNSGQTTLRSIPVGFCQRGTPWWSVRGQEWDVTSQCYSVHRLRRSWRRPSFICLEEAASPPPGCIDSSTTTPALVPPTPYKYLAM